MGAHRLELSGHKHCFIGRIIKASLVTIAALLPVTLALASDLVLVGLAKIDGQVWAAVRERQGESSALLILGKTHGPLVLINVDWQKEEATIKELDQIRVVKFGLCSIDFGSQSEGQSGWERTSPPLAYRFKTADASAPANSGSQEGNVVAPSLLPKGKTWSDLSRSEQEELMKKNIESSATLPVPEMTNLSREEELDLLRGLYAKEIGPNKTKIWLQMDSLSRKGR